MDLYPDELLKPLIPFISLVNMDYIHNEVIRIFKQISPLTMKIASFPNEERFTKKKRRTFENYRPAGLMKREWMMKHQNLVPSVAISLCEWKIDEDWKTQELLIIGTLEKLKQALGGRSTKIILLLLVKKDLVDRDDLKADEFLSNLKKITQLESRQLYVIDERDMTSGLNQKLAKNVIDYSVAYYKETLLKIKKHKSEAKYPPLQIRHKIKAAFFNEILGHAVKVQKNFESAYTMLLDLKEEKYAIHEVHMVADYLNFKLCQSKFGEKKTDAAIKQFLNHMSWFRKNEGDLLFEHWALVYRQYRTFGEMIEKVVESNNTFGPFGNPGYYFECSANAYRNRKTHALKICSMNHDAVEKLLQTTKLDGETEAKLKTGYIGQRTKGFQGINYLKEIAAESTVVHSEDIIRMLTKSYDHYYKRNQKRMIYFIANLIAEEHLFCGRYEKAKRFFERILSHYKKDGWFYPLTSILKSSLECCKEMKITDQYLAHSLELMSDKSANTWEERIEIMTDVIGFLEEPKFAPFTSPVEIAMDATHPLLSLKVQFEHPFINVFGDTSFSVQIVYRGPQAMDVSQLCVVFSSEQYNITSDNLVLNQGSNIFTFPMVIREKGDLEVMHATMKMGKDPKSIVFKWQMLDNKYYLSLLNAYDHRNEIDQDLFVHRPVIRSTDPIPKLTVSFDHKLPILIDEYFPLTIHLDSGEHVLSGKIIFNVDDEMIKLYDSEFKNFKDTISFGEILLGERKDVEIYVKTKSFETVAIDLRFDYDSTTYQGLIINKRLDLQCLYPIQPVFLLEATRRLQDGQMQLIPFYKTLIYQSKDNEMASFELKEEKSKKDKVSYIDVFPLGQEFVCTIRLTNSAPFPLLIKKLRFVSDTMKLCTNDLSVDATLKNKDIYTHVMVLKPTKVDESASVGDLMITWEREGSTKSNSLVMKLPAIKTVDLGCQVSVNLPTKGQVGSIFNSIVTVQNDGFGLREFSLSVGECEGFVYSGVSTASLIILPNSKRDLHLSFIPILPGYQTLPKFTLKTPQNNLLIHEDEEWALFIEP